MYSLPLLEASTRIARFNTAGTDYLMYFGEWKPMKGDAWVFARTAEAINTDAVNYRMTTKAGQALRYLGERLTTSGVKFYLADDMRGTVGWISERVVEIVPIDAAKVFRRQINEGMSRK